VWLRQKKGLRKPTHDGKRGRWLNKGDSLVKANGLDMQVDTNPASGSCIEFVSDAFNMNPAGRNELVASLDQLTVWKDGIEGIRETDN
jgi:hypothetical protein